MLGEEILGEIDDTLNLLIENAKVIEESDIHELSDVEMDAFQKTQESLLHHLIYMDGRFTKQQKMGTLDKKRASFQIQEKLKKFEKMKGSYQKKISAHRKKAPILAKRRNKRLLKFC